MKVMLTIVMLSVLVVGGAALQCYDCIEAVHKINCEVIRNSGRTFFCDQAKSTKKCGEAGNDTRYACVTLKYEFKEIDGSHFNFRNHSCVDKATNLTEYCTNEKRVYEGVYFVEDKSFTCSYETCETDLCNSEHIQNAAHISAQISFLMLAATVGLYGLLF
jgi:hypothetical protein